MTMDEQLLRFWGKKGKDGSCHPLLFHMLDVAYVAHAMWAVCLHAECRAWVCRELGLPGREEEVGRLLAFWAGLHDLGKAYHGFQEQSEKALPHGVVTAVTLGPLLETELRYPKRLATQLATILGGHHGVLPGAEKQMRAENGLAAGGARQVERDLRLALVRALRENLDVWLVPLCRQIAPPLAMFLAGLVSVTDWVGSRFPCAVAGQDLRNYLIAHPQPIQAYVQGLPSMVDTALRDLHWTGWEPPEQAWGMEDLFPFLREDGLRPMQTAVRDVVLELKPPFLLIVEAPMGEGKTEAALYVADRANALQQQRGFYVALPTMATSNQMFSRVKQYLAGRYNNSEIVNLMLLHGHAALEAEFKALLNKGQLPFVPQTDDRVLAGAWFTHRKRGLLAPFGVGTVDQTLLAVLQTRHAFVRLFGLAHKTVIFDEVHAYDAYMTTLFERLLEWLAALGTSVVMLSATLPQEKRDGLIRAYAKGLTARDGTISPQAVPAADYPRLAWVAGGGSSTGSARCGSRPFQASPDSHKDVALKWMDGNLPAEAGQSFPLGEALRQALAQGGCAAVVCNTVRRAQKVFLALKPFLPGNDEEDGLPCLDLFHARYLFRERDAREKRALTRFGKPGGKVTWPDGRERDVRRPHLAVLVATQVIEQSLDLDFDLMVTDFAPVDLLLQRAGRLHRHKRGQVRPAALGTPEGKPQVWVVKPGDGADGLPDFGRDNEAVYERYILLRTWLALDRGQRRQVNVPGDMDPLMNAVYASTWQPDGLPPALQQALRNARADFEGFLQKAVQEADDRCLKWPHYSGELARITEQDLDEDDPVLHDALRALTRLAERSVEVVFLEEKDRKLYLPHTEEEISIQTESAHVCKRLLACGVRLAHWGVVAELLDEKNAHEYCVKGWRQIPLLRHARLIRLRDSRKDIGRFVVRLDQELGVLIESRP